MSTYLILLRRANCALVAVTAGSTLVLSGAATASANDNGHRASCAAGSPVYRVAGGHRHLTVTHASAFQVQAHASKTLSGPVAVRRVITASVSGGTERDGALVLRAAHRQFLKGQDTVQRPGDHTSTAAVDIGSERISNNSNEVRQYVRYRGVRVYRGTWTKHICGTATATARGTWATFSAVNVSGDALCSAKPYPGRSVQAQACRLARN